MRPLAPLCAVASAVLVAALFEPPSPYLRVVRVMAFVTVVALGVSGSRALVSLRSAGAGEPGPGGSELTRGRRLVWWLGGLPAMVAAAVLYNPVVPVQLGERLQWRPLDLATALVTGVAAVLTSGLVDRPRSASTSGRARQAVVIGAWSIGAACWVALGLVVASGDGGLLGGAACGGGQVTTHC